VLFVYTNDYGVPPSFALDASGYSHYAYPYCHQAYPDCRWELRHAFQNQDGWNMEVASTWDW